MNRPHSATRFALAFALSMVSARSSAAEHGHGETSVETDAHAPAAAGTPEPAHAPEAHAPEAHAPAQHPPVADHATDTHATPPEHAGPDHRAEEIASLLRIGDAKLAAPSGPDTDSAIIAYRQAARLADGDAQASALLGLGRALRLAGDSVKAVATYERLCQDHPTWKDLPVALLELGRALREAGAPRLAMNRFYSVIHTTLKLPDAEADLYRRLVRTAQFEIAETHLIAGDAAEAVRFFRRLDLLDLAPADAARARFRTAQALLLAGDRAGARTALERSVALDGEAADGAEARFLLARLLAEDGRRDEALQVTLDLLRLGHTTGDSPTWRGWQRRAGNLLANRFHDEGEFYSALLLYRALALLDPEPVWRAPVLYQVGLCQERLRQPAAARETYAEILKLIGENPPAELAELARMTTWRSGQLDWTTRVRDEIQSLSGQSDEATPVVAATPTPETPATTTP